MRLSISESRRIMHEGMVAHGHSDAEATIIVDHLLDCELRGVGHGGMARALAVIEFLQAMAQPLRPMAIQRETPSSAQLDGGNQVGYVVGRRATDIAIAKARSTGLAIVGAHKTWYTGMFSYYLERVTEAGFVGLIAGSGPRMVAPHGGTEPLFNTNPIAFGFPARELPVIWDSGTSLMTFAEVLLRRRLGQALPDGTAFDPKGAPTNDPAAALEGALAVWGGHRGSGLALSVQLLAMLAGQLDTTEIREADCGFFIVVVDPALFGDRNEFRDRVEQFAVQLRANRPLDPDRPVRVPFERSAAARRERLAAGWIEVSELVVQGLREAGPDRQSQHS